MTAKQSTVKEELQPMKEIRYWVGKVLTPEQSEVEKKPEPKHSLKERLQHEQAESKKRQEQKTPQHKKQNMDSNRHLPFSILKIAGAFFHFCGK